MPFWSKRDKPAPATPRRKTRSQSEFDYRFGIRLDAVKNLSREVDGLQGCLHSLDLAGLNELEQKALEILRMQAEYLADVRDEIARDPRMLDVFPTLPTMLNRYADEAEPVIRWVKNHRQARFPVSAIADK